MLKIKEIRVDYGRLPTCRIVGSEAPVFSWAVTSDQAHAVQTACRVRVTADDTLLWDSGVCIGDTQQLRYAGRVLPEGRALAIAVTVWDNDNEKAYGTDIFYFGLVRDWRAAWIAASEDIPKRAVCFSRKFQVEKAVQRACLYVCGLGYQQIVVNGLRADNAVMSPAHSNYAKTCYYTVSPDAGKLLRAGENEIVITVGDGWRRVTSGFLEANTTGRTISFFGIPQLTAFLSLEYEDGTSWTIETDENWEWSHGPIQFNDLYDGETYDAAFVGERKRCVRVDTPCQRLLPQTIEPILEQEVYWAQSVYALREGVYIIDFGQNIAGVPRVHLPEHMEKGQVITLRHAEMLDEDGGIYTLPLREAKATDTYIASGDGNDLEFWQPVFTYHGFRYVEVTGWNGTPDKHDFCAVALYTDVKSESWFTCGSALVNAIHKNIVQTEKANIHSILTDCPQRDERMAWMNDATVRFEETPYNFDIGRLFPKVVRDLLDSQFSDGAITCTSPFVFGMNPADPVCSSFLIAGLESLMHTGNCEIIAEGYEGFAAWERLLGTKTSPEEPYIINYSYYGDWAGPAYACVSQEFACSATTPGILMSTGYYYFNAVCLAKCARILGKDTDAASYDQLAANIRSAYLKKWWDAKTGRVGTGSQGCQAFSLWLGILPEDGRAAAARVMRDDLAENSYRMTTGNLCTRYLFDMLAEYGYIDDAWELLTREDYPSYGYMIQNEATTIWERFELKKDPGMNSHCHPMFGAVGYWLYAYLCGIKITAPGASHIQIAPYMPRKLRSASASMQTIRGDISVRWVKRFAKKHLYVTIPFGVTATIRFAGQTHTTGSGSYHFEQEDV